MTEIGVVVAAVAAWLLRDRIVVMRHREAIPILTNGRAISTSILAHGVDGIRTLLISSAHDSWSTALFVVAGAIACVLASPAKVRAIAFAALAI